MLQHAQSAEEQYVGRAGEEGLGDAYARKDELEFASVRLSSASVLFYVIYEDF